MHLSVIFVCARVRGFVGVRRIARTLCSGERNSESRCVQHVYNVEYLFDVCTFAHVQICMNTLLMV